jgi:multicomponent K+:H+ antiporter subunit A
VEVVTTVLFLLGLRWLPKRIEPDDPRTACAPAAARRARDLAVALAIGGGMAALSYALMTRPGAAQSISPFFIDNALPEGGGTNVVNVMLVDFRAFDTLGEITVLASSALTVYALLRRFRPARESGRATPAARRRRRPASDLIDPTHGDDTCRLPDGAGRAGAPAAAGGRPVRGPFLHARPQRTGRRLRRRAGGGHRLHHAVHGGGTRWVEARMHLRPTRWIADRPADGAGHRAGLAGCSATRS